MRKNPVHPTTPHSVRHYQKGLGVVSDTFFILGICYYQRNDIFLIGSVKKDYVFNVNGRIYEGMRGLIPDYLKHGFGLFVNSIYRLFHR